MTQTNATHSQLFDSMAMWAKLAWRYPFFARHSSSNTRYVIAICLLLTLGALYGAVHAATQGGAYLFVLEFSRSISSFCLPRFESWSDAAWAIYATAMFAMLAPLFISPTPEEKADFSTYRESLVVYAFGLLTLPGYPTSYLHPRLARLASRLESRFALSGSNIAIQCLGRAASSSVQSLAYGVPLFFHGGPPFFDH